jgi:hypothetical protein
MPHPKSRRSVGSSLLLPVSRERTGKARRGWAPLTVRWPLKIEIDLDCDLDRLQLPKAPVALRQSPFRQCFHLFSSVTRIFSVAYDARIERLSRRRNSAGKLVVLLQKAFTAPALDEARSHATRWLTLQKGIRLVRQKQATSTDSGTSGHHPLWTVTLYYETDTNQN